MIITNKTNLPEFFARAVRENLYSRGDSQYSITDLINPPQIRILERLHDHEVSVDITDMIDTFIGSAIHEKVERAGLDEIQKSGSIPEILERRLFDTIDGVKISGATDCYEPAEEHLWDIKTTKAGKIVWGEFLDWERQTNSYAYLMRKNGLPVSHVSIMAVVKDFNEKDRLREQDYPKYKSIVIPLRLANPEDAESYVKSRVRIHKAAAEDISKFPCTEKDRWSNNLRCKKYCRVSKWCEQAKKLLKGKYRV